ncbi:hypothetical protein DPEC_G00148420 [Dallia pectoralis]|uniref:Uncharacterized protein n=1 Tax=Dallia pectoralis TaxID=75939 RepID=A0ACC2GIS8_DALPE|nr:hypothetical protein DPEC_G00148420 [Dallia pectoralis]
MDKVDSVPVLLLPGSECADPRDPKVLPFDLEDLLGFEDLRLVSRSMVRLDLDLRSVAWGPGEREDFVEILSTDEAFLCDVLSGEEASESVNLAVSCSTSGGILFPW